MPHVTGCLPSTMPGRGTVDRALWENRLRDPVRLRQEFEGPKGRGWLLRWLPARAWENGVYAVFSNPIGLDDTTIKPGLAMILDPFGEVLAESRELGDDVVVALLTGDKIVDSSGRRYLRRAGRSSMGSWSNRPRPARSPSQPRAGGSSDPTRNQARVASHDAADAIAKPPGDAQCTSARVVGCLLIPHPSRTGCHDAKAPLDARIDVQVCSVLLACSCSTLVAFLGLAGCTRTASPERVPPPPTVTVVESKKMTVPIIVNPIGTTRALEEVTIRARVMGFLTERHFEYGTNVKKGQLLLVIDEEPFQVALNQAKAQLDAAAAAARESPVVQGSRGRQGDPGARPGPDAARRGRRAPRANSPGAQSGFSRRLRQVPRPRSSRVRPRSRPTRLASNRPWPTSRSTSTAPKPMSKRPGPPSTTLRSIWAIARCTRRSTGESAS